MAGQDDRTETPPLDAEALAELCRGLPGATEDVKWDDDLVFSVGGKMFACFHLPAWIPFSFKVEDSLFDALIQHEGVDPAPYLARYLWILVRRYDALPAATLGDLVVASYTMVLARLPKKVRATLGSDSGAARRTSGGEIRTPRR